MYWRFSKDIKKEFVSYLRRVFKYLNTVTNEDIEIIDWSSDQFNQLVFEKWVEENERYPSLIISSEGGSLVNISINDHIDTKSPMDSLGETVTSYSSFGEGTSLGFYFVPATSYTLDRVEFTLANSGIGSEGNITISLATGSASSISTIILSSGSIQGFASTQFKEYSPTIYPLYPKVDLVDNQGYWVILSTTDDSKYYSGTDQAVDGYQASGSGSNWVFSSEASPYITIYGVSQDYIGGGGDFTIRIDCLARDIDLAHNLADTAAMYILLAKTTNINRTKTDMLEQSVTPSFLQDEKGYQIKGVRIGGETARERGRRLIYQVSLTVDVHSFWNKPFDQTMLDIINTTETIYE